MPLQTTHRPSIFETFIGNEDQIEALQIAIDREDFPHSFLCTGAPGTGKTTLANILKEHFKCSEMDFYYYNGANTRGIDTIRDIAVNCHLAPMGGPIKIYVLDECFAKGTLVSTPNGNIAIEHINAGDKIYNIIGTDMVTHTFINKVALNRVCRISLSNNKTIFCSEDHLFLTEEGWLPAKKLDNTVSLCYGCHQKECITSQTEPKNEKEQTIQLHLPSVPKTIYRKSMEYFGMPVLCTTTNNLQMVWDGVYYEKTCVPIRDMFSQLSTKIKIIKSKFSPITVYKRTKSAYQKRKSIIFTNAFSKRARATSIPTNAKQQPSARPKNSCKNKRDKKNKRDITCVERKQRGERTSNTVTSIISNSVGVGNRICNFFRNTKDRVPYLLQSRYGTSIFKNSDRSRRERTSFATEYIIRQKERQNSRPLRVESVAVYQRGDNDESFKSIIGNTERDQGYVEFYDLEVEKHPSYTVENCIVHNCHQITGTAIEAMLLLLENPPKDTIFILCTSEPEKLKLSIKRRCFQCNLLPLPVKDIISVLANILETEKVDDIPLNVLEEIGNACQGSAGMAVAMLDAVIDITEAPTQLSVIASMRGVNDAEGIDICRALMNKNWKQLQVLLSAFNGEAESLRYMILSYFSTVLLGKNKAMYGKANEVIMIFGESFMYSKKAGLISSCYIACQ